MRPNLLHPLGEHRHARRGAHGRTPAPIEAPATALGAPAAALVHAGDAAVERVREAGGPVDRAYYICSCGYLFSASVSTTVSCPECGSDQAW
jgi:hypothetical protein